MADASRKALKDTSSEIQQHVKDVQPSTWKQADDLIFRLGTL